jgi:hypothetical protein
VAPSGRTSPVIPARREKLSAAGESLRLVLAQRATLLPDRVEPLAEPFAQLRHGLLELDVVVGVGNRVGVAEDPVGARDEPAGALVVAVVQCEDAGVEVDVWPQVLVVVGEDPLARDGEAAPRLLAVAAVELDVDELWSST